MQLKSKHLWTDKDISNRIAEHAQEHHHSGAQCILVEYAGRAMHHIRGDFRKRLDELGEEMDALLVDLAETNHRIEGLEAENARLRAILSDEDVIEAIRTIFRNLAERDANDEWLPERDAIHVWLQNLESEGADE